MSKLDIIYEDEELIAINKSPGMLSIPDRYDPTIPNLQSMLKRIYHDIYVVHRLDKNTSGVILFAKNASAHKHLNQQFQDRETQKYYLAIVKGHPPMEEGTIETGIKKTSSGKAIIHDKGAHSITKYELIDKFKYHSLLQLELLTGRTHQARVHLQFMGCPLVVDPDYGGDEGFYLSSIKRNYHLGKHEEERPLVDRTPLHAAKLLIRHPKTEESLTLEADLPKDMNALLNQLQKWSSIKGSR
jgi:RluA family pseudouridine synthase